MSQQKEIIAFVLHEFTGLVTQWGFQPPIISESDWITRIDYLKNDLGVEIELDWREFALFSLLVRLENGQLPDGYYISNGRKCRKHLNGVIREQGWEQMHQRSLTRKNTITDLKETAIQAKRVLLEHLERITQVGDTLFN